MAILDDLKELLEIESMLSDKAKSAPFGEPLKETLDRFLAKAESYGLKTGSKDGYYGYAELGDGEEMIGILCHLDVVPPGSGWSYEPFTLTVDGGKLYGRGVVDDKGPAVTMLHVLKTLKENDVKLKNRIRLIVGLNEESGSECLKHYKKHGEIPKLSIVPDADFPVINSEKAILQAELTVHADESFLKSIISFEAGTRANVVPDTCTVRIKKDSPLGNIINEKAGGSEPDSSLFSRGEVFGDIVGYGAEADDFSLRAFEDRFELEARGVAGHAMAPEKADNAIYKMFMVLDSIYGGDCPETLELLYTLFASPLNMERLGIAIEDEKSGALSLSTGKIKLDGKKIVLTLDLRLPLSADKDAVKALILEKLPEKSKFKELHYAPNLYIEPDSDIVKTLLKIYADVTGERLEPKQIGGGTYARELPNSIAFGPTFSSDDTHIHDADENISIEHFEKWFDIYYKAILALDDM